jgi:hypothetical protein
MPPQKAYKDWNTAWNPVVNDNENSWEVTEPAIYYQAPYVLLVSQYATAAFGDGLLGTYYDETDFSGATATRTDPAVNFDWGTGPPAPGIGADTFTVRWTGQVQAVEAGAYTFRAYSDDGITVWVNGRKVIDDWNDHATPVYRTGTVTLAAGRRYDIRVEYYDFAGAAAVRLEWTRPGQTSFAVVPQTLLFAGPLRAVLVMTPTAEAPAGQLPRRPSPLGPHGAPRVVAADPPRAAPAGPAAVTYFLAPDETPNWAPVRATPLAAMRSPTPVR